MISGNVVATVASLVRLTPFPIATRCITVSRPTSAFCRLTVRKVSDQPVAQRAATVRLPNDEMFIAKSLPFDRLAVTERMALGEHDKQTLIPERGDVAIGCVARVRQERHIKAPLSYQRNVLTRRTLDNLNGHVRMPFGIGLYQLPKKAGSH